MANQSIRHSRRPDAKHRATRIDNSKIPRLWTIYVAECVRVVVHVHMFAHEAVACKILLVVEIGRPGPGAMQCAGEMRMEGSFRFFDR